MGSFVQFRIGGLIPSFASSHRKVEPKLLIPARGAKRRKTKPMTMREAVIQAHIELGWSRESAELSTQASDAVLPEAASLADSPVKPGMEREFIEQLKQTYRKMDANPQIAQFVAAEINKRASQN